MGCLDFLTKGPGFDYKPVRIDFVAEKHRQAILQVPRCFPAITILPMPHAAISSIT